MFNIVFYENQLCERGTTIALFDYAFYNEKILQNKSIIVYDVNSPVNNTTVIEKFTDHFKVIGINIQNCNMQELLDTLQCDVLYTICYGLCDKFFEGLRQRVIRHCVFTCCQPHGDVYASISKNVNGYNENIPIVPHMINLPDTTEDIRAELNIPESATVFGRYGGLQQFSLSFVHEIIYNVALENKHLYFLFANTAKFCPDLPNIIHLPTIVDLTYKVKFINTCDAMIHARIDGETFGLSIAEFSTKNKPIFSHKCGDLAHTEFLKEKGIWYNNDNLKELLIGFDRNNNSRDWNCYKEFTPENVMKLFDQYFLQNLN